LNNEKLYQRVEERRSGRRRYGRVTARQVKNRVKSGRKRRERKDTI
jgi:hypothetical protein